MAKPGISIISAISQNRAIGKKDKLLWHIGEDLRRFKKLTSGYPVIMGRKTFESIGGALPHRTNIVVTHHEHFKVPGVVVAHSLKDAIKAAESVEDDEIFIIGGGQIYEQAIKLADKLYLTIVEGDYDADTFFPDYSDFKKVVYEEPRASEGYKYKFIELER